MAGYRRIKKVFQSQHTVEGAGVHLHRAFGYPEVPMFDPFLLLDDFHSSNPADYQKGFPWHPHRGIETVTYMLKGRVRHGDSMGNHGVIGPGDMQWMTAGRGIIHEEMPDDDSGELWGLQLWVNLPKANKMMQPRYREIKAAQIPKFRTPDGTEIKVIAGRINGDQGPVTDIICQPEYLDITVPGEHKFEYPVKKDHTVFAYVLKGDGIFDASGRLCTPGQAVLLENGDTVRVKTKDEMRFLLISGKPIGEPIAWQGPIVMNTQEELRTAFMQYRQGTFLD